MHHEQATEAGKERPTVEVMQGLRGMQQKAVFREVHGFVHFQGRRVPKTGVLLFYLIVLHFRTEPQCVGGSVPRIVFCVCPLLEAMLVYPYNRTPFSNYWLCRAIQSP